MNFLAPWAFGFAAIAPVIVLLYLLKLRRRSVNVSTLLFWQRVLEESRRRAFFQRLRNVFSLLLHLLIFALILLALAKPVFDRAVRAGVSTVLVVDTRVRMQASEPGGESRFEQARKLADNYLRQAGPLREMAILVGGAESRVVAPFSDDDDLLREVLGKEKPSDAGGELTGALNLADNLLASRAGKRRIVLLTDQAVTDWKPQTADTAFEVRPVGNVHDNLAITRFAARPLPASPETCEVLLEIQNFGTGEAAGNTEIALDGNLIDVRPFRLAAGERSTVVFPSLPVGSAESRGWLTAKLDRADALAADNQAFAQLPRQQPRRVLLITKGNWFLEKLLAADNRVQFELLSPDSFRPSMLEQFDAVLFDRFVPKEMDLATIQGNALFIRDTPLPQNGDGLSQPLVSDVDERHPALRLVSLQNVTIARAAALTMPESNNGWRFDAPLRSFENPLLITAEKKTEGRQRQRLAVLAFDLVESDLPLRIAFPLLMGNLVQWLSGEVTAPAMTARAGEVLDFPESTSIEGPVRESAETQETATGSTFRPMQNGFYKISGSGAESWMTVNTFDERESNLRSAPPVPIAPERPALASTFTSITAGWPLWRYLALAAVTLLCVEWWLFHRRRTE